MAPPLWVYPPLHREPGPPVPLLSLYFSGPPFPPQLHNCHYQLVHC